MYVTADVSELGVTCSGMWKTNAVAERFPDLSLACQNYKVRHWHFTKTPDIN